MIPADPECCPGGHPSARLTGASTLPAIGGDQRAARPGAGELLDRVTDDLAVNGLVDFSLRRAARAAGTTHKVLLYHFDGADDLLVQAILRLRDRRIDKGLAAAGQGPASRRWPVGCARCGRRSWGGVAGARPGHRADDVRHGAIRGDSGGERRSSTCRRCSSLCPADWSDQRKLEVAEMILAALRGFLIDRLTSDDTSGVDAGRSAGRALDREEAAGE